MKKRAVVALSGGVDSSFAALSLKESGYEVIGVHLKLFSKNSGLPLPHSRQEKNLARVRQIADELALKLIIRDVSREFEKQVIDYFINAYASGITPNPCIFCNPEIKFSTLLDIADKVGAEVISTGHYARVEREGDTFLLKKAVYPEKDQSYFLYRLGQAVLSRTVFPLGNYSKDRVKDLMSRTIASVDFPEESQEVCFIEGDYREFLLAVAPELTNPGPIVDESGKQLGEHRGIAFYTVGQRKGLGIATGKPMYVIRIDAASNTLVVGPEERLYPDAIIVGDLKFPTGHPPGDTFNCTVKARYRMKEVPAAVKLKKDLAEVHFSGKCAFPAPGQAAVFYQGDTVIGGGTILRWL